MQRLPAPDLPPCASARPGTILAGKYRVERVIGRGGMGLVVAATHLHLGERVAIKLLLPGAPVRSDAFERFLREGRAAARIRSEHVARVHDAGVLASGEPYLVLEYLKGVDLRALLRERGRLPIDTAVLYVLQVCEALAEAHALGIIHRDLKPGNIFLTRRADGSEAVKVIDFGISKITSPDADGREDGPLTGSDSAVGTPSYMAPEQMRAARAADARADIWSLGAVLHGLLTGSPPFAGETIIEVYDSILEGAPSLRAARADVPAELEAAVLRCLRFDRAERYDDVGQLAAALAELAPPEGRLSAERAIRTARGLPKADDLLDGERAIAGASRAAPPTRALDDASARTGSPPPGAATSDGSFASERPDTGTTQEPSWPDDRARESAPSSPLEAASTSALAAPRAAPPPRASINPRTTILIFTGAVIIAIGGAATGYALHKPAGNTTVVAAIAPESAAPAAARPSSLAAPSSPIASPAPQPFPSVTATVTPTAPRLIAPRRSPDGSRSATPPPASAIGTATSSTPPRVPGLAQTPD